MKKMTKWLAVCTVCVMGSVPAMAAEVPDVTVTPIPIETPAPDVTPIETPAPTPIPEVKNGWYEYGTKNKKYFKDGQYLTGMRKIHGEVYYFSPKGFMKTGWIKYNNKKYYFEYVTVALRKSAENITISVTRVFCERKQLKLEIQFIIVQKREFWKPGKKERRFIIQMERK